MDFIAGFACGFLVMGWATIYQWEACDRLLQEVKGYFEKEKS